MVSLRLGIPGGQARLRLVAIQERPVVGVHVGGPGGGRAPARALDAHLPGQVGLGVQRVHQPAAEPDQPGRAEEARRLLRQVEAKPLDVHVPALLLYESGNILLLKTDLDANALDQAIDDLGALPFIVRRYPPKATS